MRKLQAGLLATAATIATSSQIHAADLPLKAKPVEYVRVCSAYGAGFFYVPGTDTCLKIGMYIRSDHSYGAGNSGSYYLSNTNARFTRSDTNFYSYRARINLTTDWRTQTDFGVLRAYASIIAQQSTGGDGLAPGGTTGAAGILRAFIQFAGFTVGHAVSYFDFFTPADFTYLAATPYNSTTGNNGIDLVAYTWQLGNGWSASLSAEDGGNAVAAGSGSGRGKVVVNVSNAAQLGAATAANTITNNAQFAWQPDIAGNIRVDQTWGSAQVMGSLHNASGSYYGGAGAILADPATSNGHPGTAWGWAIGGGLRLANFLAPGNTFEVQAAYGRGATGYVTTLTSYAGYAVFGSGNSLGLGYATDGVFVTGSNVELTESWSVSAAYQHRWNTQWRTSLIGGYVEFNYNGSATAMLCGANPNSAGAGAGLSTVFGALRPGPGFGCNPDFSVFAASTRTAWNPHPMLEIGLDLIWNRLNTGFSGIALMNSANGSRPSGPYQLEDQNNFMAIMRVQKTVLP